MQAMDLVPYWLTAGFPRPALSQTGAQGFLAHQENVKKLKRA